MIARCSLAAIVSRHSGGLFAHCQKRSNASITGPPEDPGRTGVEPSLRRLCQVFDLGEELRLDPDALVKASSSYSQLLRRAFDDAVGLSAGKIQRLPRT